MLFMLSDIELTGDLDCGAYDQPSGAQSSIFGCAKCKSRIYAVNDSREGMASLRCGTLDNSSKVVPAAHLWVKSKQAWIGLPSDVKRMDEQPRSQQEWIEVVGVA
jgi:hypothetical protein